MSDRGRRVASVVSVCILVAGGMLAAGCRSARQPATVAPLVGPPAVLRVTSDHTSDVRIYLVQAGKRIRLGMVSTHGSAVFAIPADFLGRDASAQILISPVGGWRGLFLTLTTVYPGETLELTVGNPLIYSHLAGPFY